MSQHVEVEGFRLPVYPGEPGWIPRVDIIPTPATRSNLRKILPPLLRGHNLLLVGDAGVGKNALIYHINALRRHPTIRYSFNEDTLPEDLVGSYRLHPGGFTWSNGPLTEALHRGATFVADEMNLASPEVLKRFQSVFAERSLQLLEGDGRIVAPAPGFSFIATQNPAEGFEGRKHLPREIQKYFTTIHLDPYSDPELASILTGLFPGVPDDVVHTIVRVNRTVEDLIIQKKVGARDMERYHFNLRNLKRLAARITDAPSQLFFEMEDIYIRPFRTEEDRSLLRDTIRLLMKEGGFISPKTRPAIEIHVNTEASMVDIGRARLRIPPHTPSYGKSLPEPAEPDAALGARVEAALERFVPVPARLEILEAIARALQFRENILLESESDVEPDAFVRFFADLYGLPCQSIVLSRGMHTGDVVGGLKPVGREGVDWVDGPLTAGLRRGHFLMIQGLEAAGPELVEKMNMLMDDAGALALPAESGESEPLKIQEHAAVFGIKYFRLLKTTPTVSRAFRNRFSALVVPPVVDGPSLKGIIEHALGIEKEDGARLVQIVLQFHQSARLKAEQREIGRSRLQPYRFGLTNLHRFLESIHPHDGMESDPDISEILREGAGVAYINEIADPAERARLQQILEKLLEGTELANLLSEWKDVAKKKLKGRPSVRGRVLWNQKDHWRDPTTGRASWNRTPREIKKGLDINTPETGGSTKEGADAWYGADTQGNRGVGEPGAGGGAWGYRSEELYQEFLKKRRLLWSYELGVSLESFIEAFAPEMERVVLNLDHLLDPDVQIRRRHRSEGSRVDARKYLSYLSGRGDDRIFDRTTIHIDEDRLRGVEVLFAINKGRRIFNFEYSIAVLVAIMSAAEILDSHRISFGVLGYSDLTNKKTDIDLEWHKISGDLWSRERQKVLFEGLASGWQGDTVAESQILESLAGFFSADAKTRILVLASDFRGARARVTESQDLTSRDTSLLREEIKKLSTRGIILLGVGLGPRNLAAALFPHHLSITERNYAELPALLARELSNLIDRYHEA